jgi:hypothetical protein
MTFVGTIRPAVTTPEDWSMKFIRTGFVIAALAVFPGAAHAWPIAFTWQLSGWVFPPQLQPGATPPAGQIDFPANNGGTFGTGSYMNPYQGSLGNVTLRGYTTQAPLTLSNPTIGSTEFGVNVTLTDWMSGQSAIITAYGSADTTWTNQGNGSWALVSSIGDAFSDAPPQSRRLGNNLYSVRIGSGESTPNSTAPISAPIEVTVTPEAAPEPGTLALAVAGLSLVGFRVRRSARGSTN